ncbi:MAG: HlyC/CorC family transporter [Thermovibrio sp.]|nr:MAG: HlyC/CorC family transporter [Thermovibrio sp.]
MEPPLVYYLLLPFLILLSALFSASETAFFSLNTLRLERLAKEGNRRAEEILRFLQNPADLIATILIGNEMVNVGIAATSAVLFVQLLGPDLGSVLAVPITVLVLLIFGEVTPKTLAIKYSERYAFFIFPFIKLISRLILPLRALLVGFAELLLKPFGVELFNKPKVLTDEEFLILVSEGAKEGIIGKEEVELIDRTLDLGEIAVREIMVPKHKIFALPEEMSVEDALKLLKDVKFSRIPVYRNSLDHIVGILYTRKILPLKLSSNDLNRKIGEFTDKPYFVPEFLTIDKLLKEMQRNRRHMAVVVDEYGNTAGIVTLDDILREIVGELPDEKVHEEVEKLSDEKFKFSGDTPIEEVKEVLNLKDDGVLNEVDTVSGLIMALLEKIPEKGEFVDYQGFRFKVEEKEGNRIKSVVVERLK